MNFTPSVILRTIACNLATQAAVNVAAFSALGYGHKAPLMGIALAVVGGCAAFVAGSIAGHFGLFS